jgi:hypothetical protein
LFFAVGVIGDPPVGAAFALEYAAVSFFHFSAFFLWRIQRLAQPSCSFSA